MTLLGVILAGGQARRIGGGDKALLDLGGRPLLERVIARLAPQVGGVALNANGDPERFKAFDLPVIADTIAGFQGPLAGVLTGLIWAKSQGASHIVTVAADTPFFPGDLTARLVEAAKSEGTPIALAATRGDDKLLRHPTFGLWPVALLDDLALALTAGTRKVVAWSDQHGAASALFETGEVDPFFNVKTPQDLILAQQFLAEQNA